jgi:Peptidase family M48
MTADRTFRLVVGIAAAAIALPLVLAWRLLPCQELVGVAVHAVGSACRLLGVAGLAEPGPVGAGLLVVVLGAAVLGSGRLGHELVLARRLDGRLGHGPTSAVSGRLARVAARVGCADRLAVVRAARPRAVCAGFLLPRVYLTTGLLEALGERELEAVLRHEAHHAVRRDPLRILVVRALAWAVFYVPVLRDLEAHFLAAKEIEADRAVVAAMRSRDALAGALLTLVGRGAPALTGLAAFDPTAARIDALATGDDPPLRLSPVRVGLSLIAVLTAVCLVLG